MCQLVNFSLRDSSMMFRHRRLRGWRMNLLSPDEVAATLSQPIVIMYWPLFVGKFLFAITVVKGAYRVAVPVAGIAFFAQALHSGVIG